MEFVSKRLNVAFKVPKEISQYAISLSGNICNQSSPFFVLDGMRCLPHMSIYSPEYPGNNIEKVISEVKHVSKKFEPIEFVFDYIDSHQGFIGANMRISDEINNVHKSILYLLNPYRENLLREKYKAENLEKINLPMMQKENIIKYGAPEVLAEYRPHVTLIRFKDFDKAKEVLKDIKWNINKFIVDSIGIYEMGDHGTCTKLLEEFSLK